MSPVELLVRCFKRDAVVLYEDNLGLSLVFAAQRFRGESVLCCMCGCNSLGCGDMRLYGLAGKASI